METVRAILRRLEEATYARDKEFRGRAVQFYEALHRWVDVPEEVLGKRLTPWGTDGFLLNARDFFWDDAFERLAIVLTPASDVRASLSKVGGAPILRISCLLGSRDMRHIADRIVRSTVVHEVVHLFDRQRGAEGIPGSSTARLRGGTAAYYNHPLEWNAFWQAGAEAAESFARKVPPKVRDYYYGDGSLRSFIEKAPGHFWDVDFLDAMDAATRRRFDKRMAALWDALREQGLLGESVDLAEALGKRAKHNCKKCGGGILRQERNRDEGSDAKYVWRCANCDDVTPVQKKTLSPERKAAKDEKRERNRRTMQRLMGREQDESGARSVRAVLGRLEEVDRKYERADVDYDTWYSDWMKQLAKRFTRAELEDQLYGAAREAKRGAAGHLRAIERTSSMQGRSQARAQARNVTAAAGDFKIALNGALEIHDLFPEHAKA